MPVRIRRLRPLVQLSERVLAPVRRLAELAGVSCSEVVEFFLAEFFEGDVPLAESVALPAPPARRGTASVIPITRARQVRPPANAEATAQAGRLRLRAAELRARAERAHDRASAACERALRARALACRVRQESRG